MRKTSTLICGVLLILFSSSNALSLSISFDTPEFPLTFGTSWDGSPPGNIEKVLQDNASAFLGGFYSDLSLSLKRVNMQVWTGNGVETNLLAEYAGYAPKNSVGWYDSSNPGSNSTIYQGSASPTVSASAYTSFGETKTFGFYLDPNGESSNRMYTESDPLQAVVYEILGYSNEYIVGFEDLKLPGGDRDYQDFIFHAKVAPIPTPEPTTLLLLGTGLAGLAGFNRRRFKKK